MFNIRLFFELLQPDGYNPLVLMPVSYQVRDPEKLIKKVGTADQDRAREILSGPFSIGRLAMEAENWKLDDIGDFLAAGVAASAFGISGSGTGAALWRAAVSVVCRPGIGSSAAGAILHDGKWPAAVSLCAGTNAGTEVDTDAGWNGGQ